MRLARFLAALAVVVVILPLAADDKEKPPVFDWKMVGSKDSAKVNAYLKENDGKLMILRGDFRPGEGKRDALFLPLPTPAPTKTEPKLISFTFSDPKLRAKLVEKYNASRGPQKPPAGFEGYKYCPIEVLARADFSEVVKMPSADYELPESLREKGEGGSRVESDKTSRNRVQEGMMQNAELWAKILEDADKKGQLVEVKRTTMKGFADARESK